MLVSWTTNEAGVTVKESSVLATDMVTVRPELRKLIIDEGP